MIKRLLCCILAVSILTSIGCVAYADTDLTEDLNFKYKLLQELDILPDNEYGDFGILRNLSKESFLAFVCNICGDYNFTEREEDTKAAVAMAENMGIIDKNQDDLYKPISYDEAMTILVRFLSYDVHARENGGFPHGYTSVAASIGLADHLSVCSGQNLKEHDVIRLLYNAINAPYAQIEYFTSGGPVYKNKSNKTVLHELRGIYKIEGVIEAAGGLFLRNDETADEGKMLIDGYSYLAGKDFSDALGMNVIAYVKEDKSNENTVLVAIPYGNEETVVYSENIAGPTADFRAVKYYGANDKLKLANIDSTAAVVYNGRPLGTYTDGAFMPRDGSIRFINNNAASGYDVVFITSYKTIVADNISKLNESVSSIYTYDADNSILSLKEKDNDIIKITDENGEVGIGDIKTGDIIKIAESNDDERRVVKGYISRNKISGKVLSVYNGDDVTLDIDGSTYVLSKAYEDALLNKDAKALEIKTGKTYKFYLDCDDKIAYAQESGVSEKSAILFAASVVGVFEPTCTVRVYTEDGEWKELVLAETVTYNNKRTDAKSVTDSLDYSRNGKLSVIRYRINSNGEISAIDTPIIFADIDDANKNAKDDEFNAVENLTDNYRPNNSSFDSEIFISDNAVIWFVDTDKQDDEKSYSLGSKTILQNDEVCSFNAYNIDEGMFSNLIIVMRSASTITSSIQQAELFVIDDVMQSINSKKEIAYSISGKMGPYEQFSYYCDESIAQGLKKGDVISVHTDSNGVIDKIKQYFVYGNNNVENMYSYPTAMHTIETIVKGRVMENSADNKWIKIDCNGEKPRIVRTSDVKAVIIYDTARDKLYTGMLSDIEKDAVIVTKLKWSRVTTLVVYQ